MTYCSAVCRLAVPGPALQPSFSHEAPIAKHVGLDLRLSGCRRWLYVYIHDIQTTHVLSRCKRMKSIQKYMHHKMSVKKLTDFMFQSSWRIHIHVHDPVLIEDHISKVCVHCQYSFPVYMISPKKCIMSTRKNPSSLQAFLSNTQQSFVPLSHSRPPSLFVEGKVKNVKRVGNVVGDVSVSMCSTVRRGMESESGRYEWR